MNDKYTKTKGIGLMPRTKVEMEVTTKVVTSISTTQVALDATNASALLVELSNTKDAIKFYKQFACISCVKRNLRCSNRCNNLCCYFCFNFGSRHKPNSLRRFVFLLH